MSTPVQSVGGGAATPVGVAASAASVPLKAANGARRQLIIDNASTDNLYVKFGATAAIASGGFTYKLTAGQILELPEPVYTGLVSGIWDGTNGYANVTEVVE